MIESDSTEVKILCTPAHIPRYATSSAAGADLYADLEQEARINPGEYILVSTGIQIEIPVGYEGQVRPRSGLARNHGIGILNSPGTIDADYRGLVQVLLVNFGKTPYTICPKDRIAQLIIAPIVRASFVPVTTLSTSKRAPAGFGTTGK